jgi:hypothetical protein
MVAKYNSTSGRLREQGENNNYKMIKKTNPMGLILIWLAVALTTTIICMIILGISTSGGEQKPSTFLGRAIPIIVYGTLFIAIVSIPFYLEWLKKHWYINLFFIAGCTIFIIKDHIEENKNSYYENTKIVTINDKNYEQIMQYYDGKFTKIRSISFYLNGRKDSTWTVFGKDGAVIIQEEYKDGQLINSSSHHYHRDY